MTLVTVTTNLEIDPWTDVIGQLDLNPDGETAKVVRVGMLPNATVEGRATVALLIALPDGRHVVAETTWRLFNTVARALALTPVAQMEDL